MARRKRSGGDALTYDSKVLTRPPKRVKVNSYELDGCDETKFIGVYRTPERAEAAAAKLRSQAGFKERPDDFTIDPYELDEDNWVGGFVTAT